MESTEALSETYKDLLLVTTVEYDGLYIRSSISALFPPMSPCFSHCSCKPWMNRDGGWLTPVPGVVLLTLRLGIRARSDRLNALLRATFHLCSCGWVGVYYNIQEGGGTTFECPVSLMSTIGTP